jgi:hypothetical protein
MAAQVTPSKQVYRHRASSISIDAKLTHDSTLQAATSLQNLKVKDSPAKKLEFSIEDKENIPIDVEPVAAPASEELKKPITEIVKVEAPKAALVAKQNVDDEPILRENPQRFVLFPIQYHEVRLPDLRVTRLQANSITDMGHVQEGRSILLDC